MTADLNPDLIHDNSYIMVIGSDSREVVRYRKKGPARTGSRLHKTVVRNVDGVDQTETFCGSIAEPGWVGGDQLVFQPQGQGPPLQIDPYDREDCDLCESALSRMVHDHNQKACLERRCDHLSTGCHRVACDTCHPRGKS